MKYSILTLALSSIAALHLGFSTEVNCNGVPQWDNNAVYATSGTLVQYNNSEFKSKWWTQGDTPSKNTSSGPWAYVGDCKTYPTLTDTLSVDINQFPKNGLTFTSPDNKTYRLTTPNTTIKLPYTGPTQYTISAAGGSITPNSFIADSDGQTLHLSYKPFPPLGDTPILAGYITASWGPLLKISDAAKMGYNVVIVAFGEINGSDISLIQNQFIGYTHWNPMTAATQADIRKDIATAKAQYGLRKVLLSVGGANGSVTIPQSQAEQETLADNTIKLLDTYGFDGIDFDMENATTTYGKYMDQFIKILKTKSLTDGEAPMVTAAPQLNSISASDNTQVSIVSTGTSGAYNQAIANGDFDYLFIQAYNTGAKTNVINGTSESDPQYIANSFHYLSKGYPGQLSEGGQVQSITVPKNTKIVIGEPATEASAGNATIFHNPTVTSPYQAMFEQYQSLVGTPQFGGVMTWDIDDDYKQGCPFSQRMSDITSKSFVSCSIA